MTVFTEEHEAYRDAARRFVENEIEPHVETWEAARTFPRELFAKVGSAGFFGAKFAQEWGGTGPDYLAEAVWIEELSRSGASGMAMDLGAHSQLASLYVSRFGDDRLKRSYLVPSIEGEVAGALAITEPEAGSDVAGLALRAEPAGDHWVLRGSKIFVTNGARADYVVVAARTDRASGAGGITLFVVDADTPGFEAERMRMLSWDTSHTGSLHFDGARVPDANRLGDPGEGFSQIMQNFQWERITMALWATALAEVSLETALSYARDRLAFGRPVIGFQVWQHRLADLAVRIQCSRALAHRALAVYASEPSRSDANLVKLASMAKLYSQRVACDAADECVQVHGGAGALSEFAAQRLWRDARVGPIGGGTDDIMREIIASELGIGRALASGE